MKKNIFKKSLIIGMSIAILACPSLSFATDGVIENVTGVEHHEREIVEERIEQVLEETLDACIIDETGTELPLEVVNVEVDKVGSTGLLSSDESAIYAATAKVKTSTSSYEKNGIDADGSLSMTWIDGKGTNNKITGLSGHWAIAKGKGTFERGKIYWGSNYSGPTWAPHSKAVSKSFSVKVNYTSTDTKMGKLKAHSIADIKSPTTHKTYNFSIQVSPTVLD